MVYEHCSSSKLGHACLHLLLPDGIMYHVLNLHICILLDYIKSKETDPDSTSLGWSSPDQTGLDCLRPEENSKEIAALLGVTKGAFTRRGRCQ